MKGTELKEFLTARGITGASLAKKMGISRQNISYMLNFGGDLKFSRIKEVAKALGIAPSEVLAADPNLAELNRVQELEVKIKELNAQICELKAEKKRLQDWVDKLLNQTK